MEGLFEMGLSHDEVNSSIELLTAAHKALDGIRTRMNDHLYMFWILEDLCKKMLEIEERLVPIMGLMIDGREMLGSLAAWNCGMTTAAERSIVNTLRAAQNGLGEIVGELHSYLSTDCIMPKEDLDEQTRLFIEGALGG